MVPKLTFQLNLVPKLAFVAEVYRMVPRFFWAEVTRAEHRLPPTWLIRSIITTELKSVIILLLPYQRPFFLEFIDKIRQAHKWPKFALWRFYKHAQKFKVTPDDPFSGISVQKMIKSDSKMDCVYPVRFWGSFHLLDTQMTNFMTRATQKLNKTEKE